MNNSIMYIYLLYILAFPLLFSFPARSFFEHFLPFPYVHTLIQLDIPLEHEKTPLKQANTVFMNLVAQIRLFRR